MRQGNVITIKLFDTVVRGLFALFVIYSLPLDEAGEFGVWLTFIGFISFILGYERYIDLQREVAGRSTRAILKRFNDTLRFFGKQYLIFFSIAVLISFFLDIKIWHILLLLVIVSGEHLSNQAYIAVIIDRSFSFLLVISSIKNTTVLLTNIILFFITPESFSFETVVYLWVAASLAYVLIAIIWWLFFCAKFSGFAPDALPEQKITQQYIASSKHFLIGLGALSALQIDRLIVGGVLSDIDVGLYFRHIALASLAIQFFNIAFYIMSSFT